MFLKRYYIAFLKFELTHLQYDFTENSQRFVWIVIKWYSYTASSSLSSATRWQELVYWTVSGNLLSSINYTCYDHANVKYEISVIIVQISYFNLRFTWNIYLRISHANKSKIVICLTLSPFWKAKTLWELWEYRSRFEPRLWQWQFSIPLVRNCPEMVVFPGRRAFLQR